MEELEVSFCDLCGTSVPESDLTSGAAARLRGKTVGGCCLGDLAPKPALPAAVVEARSTGGLVTGVFVLLVAVAAATVFLEWRLHETADEVGRGVVGVRDRVAELDDRFGRLEGRVARTAAVDDLASVERATAGIRDDLRDRTTAEAAADSELRERLVELEAAVQRSGLAGERQIGALAELALEVRALGRDLAALRAAPREAPTVDPRLDEPPVMVDDEIAAPGLPAELAHQIERLGDPDAGTRFEAVSVLLDAADARVFPHMLPLARDADMFVRRLVVEGLGDYRAVESVDALINALADPEGIVRHTAYASLRKLTQQSHRFDPEASPDQRTAAQRRWLQWWDKNRDSFF